jgi:hypothetical protein
MIRAACVEDYLIGLDRPFYAIVHIQTGKVWYQGQNLDKAADMLEPGTCFGEGLTVNAAIEAATEQAKEFKAASAAKWKGIR